MGSLGQASEPQQGLGITSISYLQKWECRWIMQLSPQVPFYTLFSPGNCPHPFQQKTQGLLLERLMQKSETKAPRRSQAGMPMENRWIKWKPACWMLGLTLAPLPWPPLTNSQTYIPRRRLEHSSLKKLTNFQEKTYWQFLNKMVQSDHSRQKPTSQQAPLSPLALQMNWQSRAVDCLIKVSVIKDKYRKQTE